MLLQEAIGRVMQTHGAFRVAFEILSDDEKEVASDFFPDADEEPFNHQEDADRMRDKFASVDTLRFTHVRTQATTDGKTWLDIGPIRNEVAVAPPDGAAPQGELVEAEAAPV